jgi:hypothetical protein
MPDINIFGTAVELLLLNASSNRAAREGAIVSGRKRGPYTSETRLVARAIALNARHKRASGVISRYAKARHLPCMRAVVAVARICQHTYYERDALLNGP